MDHYFLICFVISLCLGIAFRNKTLREIDEAHKTLQRIIPRIYIVSEDIDQFAGIVRGVNGVYNTNIYRFSYRYLNTRTRRSLKDRILVTITSIELYVFLMMLVSLFTLQYIYEFAACFIASNFYHIYFHLRYGTLKNHGIIFHKDKILESIESIGTITDENITTKIDQTKAIEMWKYYLFR